MLKRFEIGIFNAEVRAALREGERHKDLDDDWADIHYIEVRAPDPGAARAKIERRYPPALGYVVTGVMAMR